VIARTPDGPVTQRELEANLRDLGVGSGQTVLVHCSLSRLGWVVGGGQAVLLALERVLGGGGTLLMPAFGDGAPEPSHWKDPPVPESWWTTIREEMPPWDPALSPSRRMGVVSELLRHQPRTHQSFHPNKSFVARGPRARKLLADQTLDDGFGERSPLGRLYEMDGWVLLLGVTHSNNTSLHLAEYRARWPGSRRRIHFSGRVFRDGRVRTVSFEDVDGNSDDFDRLGIEFERQGRAVAVGRVGRGTGRFLRMRPLVDFAVGWMERNRSATQSQEDSRLARPPRGSRLRHR
jgi:aminoglycoside 3-N-acetyltransferase